jgi:hypothetical protein
MEHNKVGICTVSMIRSAYHLHSATKYWEYILQINETGDGEGEEGGMKGWFHGEREGRTVRGDIFNTNR